MPAPDRPAGAAAAPAAAARELPSIDETTGRFPVLFDERNGFDLRTVEPTAQLADQTILVTSDGRRFLVSSIPDASVNANSGQALAEPTVGSRVSSQVITRPSTTQSFSSLIRKSLRRRSSSNAGPCHHSASDCDQLAQSPRTISPVSPGEPREPVADVTTMMSRLDTNSFSAGPLYWESDGGVQAAEALTESHAGFSAAAGPGSPMSPLAQLNLQEPVMYGSQRSSDTNKPPHAAGLAGNVVNFDYVNYTAQTNNHLQQSRHPVATGLPSLLELASPMPQLRRESELYSPLDVPIYDPEKEFVSMQRQADCSPETSAPYLHVPSQEDPRANFASIARNYTSSDGYDTLTPVVVHPPISLVPSSSSDGASTSRDNVLPGEDLLFDW